mgnify:CR=1 FL=1
MSKDFYRQATYKGNDVEYYASSSEKALEGMCEYFEGSLNKAFIEVGNGVRLIRVAKPGIIETSNGFAVLGFQHTRFALDHHNNQTLRAFNENRIGRGGRQLKPLDFEGMLRQIWGDEEDATKKRSEDKIIIDSVTQPSGYRNIWIARWEKEICAVAYGTKDREESEDFANKLGQYKIHDLDGLLHDIQERKPLIHLSLRINPVFLIGGHRDDETKIYDSLYINFPYFNSEHNLSVNAAKNLACIDREIKEDSSVPLVKPKTNLGAQFTVNREIHSSVPRGQTISFLTAYLNRFLRDKEFW